MTHSFPTIEESRERRSEASITTLNLAGARASTSLRPQRRSHSRYAVELDVDLGSEHNFYQGFVENLSAGGIFVATHLLKRVGSTIELCIHMPDGRAVRGVGEVRWIRDFNPSSDVPPGMGIRFVSLEPGSEEAITRFAAARDPLFYED